MCQHFKNKSFTKNANKNYYKKYAKHNILKMHLLSISIMPQIFIKILSILFHFCSNFYIFTEIRTKFILKITKKCILFFTLPFKNHRIYLALKKK